MPKAKILLQLDPDAHASVFDAVVAIDSGVEHLLQYANVEGEQVRGLVHGAMFTRGPKDLHQTAIFIGGSNVAAGERLLKLVKDCFFGPMRVSVLFDANGANTTAAAAVLSAAKHVDLRGTAALILAGTGPVGQRAARLLLGQGAQVRLASRELAKAKHVCDELREALPAAELTPVATQQQSDLEAALEGVQIVIAAGAAGVELLPADVRRSSQSLRAAIDLNAVPPLGIGGVEMLDSGVEREGVVYYGALGVGGLKMKIHRAAIEKLFTANTFVLDAEEVFEIGNALLAAS